MLRSVAVALAFLVGCPAFAQMVYQPEAGTSPSSEPARERAGGPLPPSLLLGTETPSVLSLYASPPAGSWAGLSLNGPRLSVAPIGGHAPGDTFRSQFVVESRSEAGADIEETSGLMEMRSSTGYAPRWKASVPYSAGQQIKGGDGGIFRARARCNSGSGPAPKATASGQPDGSGGCTWDYVGIGAGTNKSALLLTTNIEPGGGDGWGASIMMGRKAGAWPWNDGFGTVLELDAGNEGADCPPGVTNGCNIFGLFLNANGTARSTVGVAIGGTQGFHIGIQGYANGASDTFMADASNGNIGIWEAGTKRQATYRDSSVSPVAIALEGNYSIAQIKGTGFSVDPSGHLSASGFKANGTAGVSCPAGTVNLSTFTVTNGIVTHC
jgi:hypothetical protein